MSGKSKYTSGIVIRYILGSMMFRIVCPVLYIVPKYDAMCFGFAMRRIMNSADVVGRIINVADKRVPVEIV